MNGARRLAGDFSPEVRELPDPPRRTDGRIDFDAVVAALAPADALETADGTGWSYVIPHVGARVDDVGGVSVLRSPTGAVTRLGTDPFRAIDDVAGELGVSPHHDPSPDLPPFSGGLVGAFSYDLGRRIEQIGDRPASLPGERHVSLRTADTLVALDPTHSRALVIARPSRFVADTPARRIDAVLAAMRDRPPAPPSRVPRPSNTVTGGPRTPTSTTLDGDAYRRAVRRILAAIAAGDVFQVNLAQRLSAAWDADTFGLYRALRRESRAAFGASLPDIGVASISPESYLRVSAGAVETRPIKGTRPRDADPAIDAALADDLATSQKDRAENIMVVDMERNDLGRVCVAGTIQVPELTRVEAHPTVWHLVSTVRGRLRRDVGYGELLRATFPCGSITGAPKIAAMRIIDDLEPVRRGWYCGAIGFLGAGSASLSVAIRTAVMGPTGLATYGAGSGIVADSDPHAEHLESLDKAAAFLRAIRHAPLDTPFPA